VTTAPTADDVLAALDPEQATAAQAVRGPVCILAGAGTGKTRTITHRAAYAVHSGAVPPSALLAVTFTARAAGEMRTRLRALGVGGVQARTFHSAAMKQLNYFWPQVVGGAPPRLVDNTFGLVANAASRARLRPGTTEVRDLLAELDWAASTLVGPEDYPAAAARAGRDGPYDPAVVAQVYDAYRDLKQAQGSADFNDLLLLTAGALEEHAGVADEFRSRYRSFVVDEYQDVTPLQQRLLDAWLGGRDDLCVVGDAHQTIYSFTGATPSFLLAFRSRFPHGQEVRLVRDYRSTPQVVGPGERRHRQGGHAGGRDGVAPPRAARPAAGRARAGLRRARRRAGRGRRRRRAVRAAAGGGHPCQRDRRPVPGQRAERGLRGGAGQRRGALPGAGRRALLRPQGGARGAAAAARRRAGGRRRRPGRPRRPDRRRPALGPVLGPRPAARGRRRDARALGVAGGPAPAGRRPRCGGPDGGPARARRRARGARRRAARARASRG
jgi:hypothetical protein